MLTVHVVDDNAIVRSTTLMALEELPVKIVEHDSAVSLLDCLASEPIDSMDIVLLDIEMPGIDGLEACRRLRQEGRRSLAVTFISSHDDLETRLTAYEAGGNDFLVKPADFGEIEATVRRALDIWQAKQALQAQADAATQTALTAISTMGDLWPVVEFFRNCLNLNDVREIVMTLMHSLQSYGLSTLVELRAGEKQALSLGGACSELERSILQHAAGLGRLFQLGNRLALNFPRITLLVSGMPRDDLVRAERLRDNVATMAEAAAARIDVLVEAARRESQVAGIVAATEQLGQVLQSIDTTSEQMRIQTRRISDNLMYALDRSLRALRVSDVQEREITELVHDAVSAIANAQVRSERASDTLRDVAAQFDKLTHTP